MIKIGKEYIFHYQCEDDCGIDEVLQFNDGMNCIVIYCVYNSYYSDEENVYSVRSCTGSSFRVRESELEELKNGQKKWFDDLDSVLGIGTPITEIAYEKYRLDWIFHHGYSLSMLMKHLEAIRTKSPDASMDKLLEDWRKYCGFARHVWDSYETFIKGDFLDAEFMEFLLDKTEFKMYLAYRDQQNTNKNINE